MTDGPAIVAEGLVRRFGGEPVVDGVTMDVRRGEVLGLIGPNGGGKSTLLLLFAGLLRPSAGVVRVDGVVAHDLALTHTGTVGLITAEQGLYPLLSGWENLRFFGGLFGLRRAEVERRAEPHVARLGLAGALDRPIGAWSSGMRQKLSLVRALLGRPKVLLLDEPTSNLDPISADALHHALREVAAEGMAVVIATHDLPAAEAMCDRVAVLRRRLLAVETFAGPRRAPDRGRLFDHYRGLLEEG
ncbi:MAG: ABC transporter ATP-binding protein [Myxococcota bacterium]